MSLIHPHYVSSNKGLGRIIGKFEILLGNIDSIIIIYYQLGFHKIRFIVQLDWNK